MNKDEIIIINIYKEILLGSLQSIIVKFRYRSMMAEIIINVNQPLTEDEIKDHIIMTIEDKKEQ